MAAVVAAASWPREPDPLRMGDYCNLVLLHVRKRQTLKAVQWRRRLEKKAAAQPGQDASIHYDRAMVRFLGGKPLDQVAAELDQARALAPPETLAVQIGGLQDQCDRRLEKGDPTNLGFRFMTP